MRKTVALFLLGAALSTLSAHGAVSSARAEANITFDAGTGEILSQKDAFQRWYPASLTKLMTVYVAFRMLESGQVKLDTPVRITALAARQPPSKMGYKVGSELTLDDALKIMMVKSANDIAMAVGETLGGSSEKFAALMNEEARRIGMTGSHFVNPNGLHSDDHYTTAHDLAIMTWHLRRDYPQFAHYFDIEAIDYGGKKPQPNLNALIGRFEGADGMKTGFVCPSGYNLIGSATRNGRTIVAVVLGELKLSSRATKAAELLAKGFETSASGRGTGQTIETLQPYGGATRDVAINMRPEVCSKTSGSDSWDGKDLEGHIVAGSPYMKRMDRQPVAEKVALLPAKLNALGMEMNRIPVPRQRPERALSDAGNAARAAIN
ncbi:D-alanyl-D-alanine carboxypeptidase [Phyllobacterium sp. 0TCS1.6C]|uniref:D-alanyl-D-alanine carboxypeptidase family protein n=1 Tax=unclassified Phyllobacterium TaxID=2638441 RepID=UPI0022649854|nr:MULTISPECIES: D-alanyl-D-alanine carboxypeptidase family protein [unclassified Phyllobacterium]MCX8281474.1 D-alanyl-D-alanine carboxypeptidase [Phyllobacterium sp. 0TCS1.6C]MCX8292930.1 D-alanyl-D-alanine carboxypeptidase [Phyllobacterium sp. 0TCS1.6A]